MWLAERVWEPPLPRVLVDAGVEYALLDDSHFALTGLDVDTLGGYYLTEEQGAVVRVFPISQRLRYLIPFAEVEAVLESLAQRRGRVPAVTMVDDGEKFGAWPGTHAHVYEKGWLDRFFDRLLATEWLELVTLGEVCDRMPATGRVYLPTASYREMGEWALPPDAGQLLERAKHALAELPDGERFTALLRGGFWRSFLVKYPEVADTYWKMLRLSREVHAALAATPGDARLLAAREALWRGQANDAYWHGVFGGCYLPHLRRAVKSALLHCERRLASLLEAWFDDPETPLAPLTPWAGARLRLFGERLDCAGRAVEGGVAVSLARAGAAPGPVGVEKLVTVAGASLGARYRLRSVESGGVNGRFAVQWNLALTAGDAEGRYLTLPDRPSLGSAGRA